MITVDLVLRGRGNMLPDKANGPEDIIVTEMLKELPGESIYENTKVTPKQIPCLRD